MHRLGVVHYLNHLKANDPELSCDLDKETEELSDSWDAASNVLQP